MRRLESGKGAASKFGIFYRLFDEAGFQTLTFEEPLGAYLFQVRLEFETLCSHCLNWPIKKGFHNQI